MNLISDLTQNIHKIVLMTAILLFAVSCEYFDSANDPVIISGKITDSSGAPVAGVKVCARTYLYSDSVISASDGKYRLKLSRAGNYQIDFQKENYTFKTVPKSIPGGEWAKLDVCLSLLSEDAYMDILRKDFIINNTNSSHFVYINTNVIFRASSTVDWLVVKDSLSGVVIRPQENELSQPRRGLVIVEGEFGLRDTINIEQQPGPVLRLINYSGKDNSMKFPEYVPFIKVSRAVTVTGLEVYPSRLKLNAVYSEDSTTITFPDFITDYFSEQTIQYTVRSSDGIQLSGSFALKAYEICFDNNLSWGIRKVLFTRDMRSIWLYQSVTQGASALNKYDITNNFAKVASISLQSNIVSVTYNPYNNTLYLQKQYLVGSDYQTDIEIYNAATGEYISKFTLERKWAVIASMVFDDKGLGLATYNGKFYSIDVINNNRMEIMSDERHQIDWLNARSVSICNNYLTYVLYGNDTSGNRLFYTYDAATKSLNYQSSCTKCDNIFTGNASFGVVLTTNDRKSIRYFDFLSRTNKIINIREGSYWAALLVGKGGEPKVLIDDASLVDVTNAKQLFFNSQKRFDIVDVANNNDFVALRFNSKLYLFRSQVFTEYFSRFY